MASTPVFISTPHNSSLTFTNADGTTKKTLITAATNGTKVSSIGVTTTDNVLRYMNVYWSDGTTDFLISQIQIPQNAGLAAANTVQVLNLTKMPWLEKDNNDNAFLRIKSGSSVKISMDTAVSAGDTLTICSFAADF